MKVKKRIKKFLKDKHIRFKLSQLKTIFLFQFSFFNPFLKALNTLQAPCRSKTTTKKRAEVRVLLGPERNFGFSIKGIQKKFVVVVEGSKTLLVHSSASSLFPNQTFKVLTGIPENSAILVLVTLSSISLDAREI